MLTYDSNLYWNITFSEAKALISVISNQRSHETSSGLFKEEFQCNPHKKNKKNISIFFSYKL